MVFILNTQIKVWVNMDPFCLFWDKELLNHEVKFELATPHKVELESELEWQDEEFIE